MTPHLWNDFVKSSPLRSLSQTSIWAHFQAKIPGKEKTEIITIVDPKNHSELFGGGLVILHSLPFGLSWIECPRGPVFRDKETLEQLIYFFKTFFEEIQNKFHCKNIVHIRIDPPIETNSPLATLCDETTKKLDLKPSHASYTPEITLIIDLTRTEDDILKQMKSKGRYNIKVAEKHGIEIKKIDPTTSKIAISEFHSLITQTAHRDNFSPHDLPYYESMLTSLGGNAALFMAYKKQKPVAGLIATYFHDTATYYYGASSYEDRNLMAPYLLQWHVMCDAKARGFTRYDLLGISPPDSKKHALAGVTDFKTKFGGCTTQYIPAKELILKPFWHTAIRFVKFFKK